MKELNCKLPRKCVSVYFSKPIDYFFVYRTNEILFGMKVIKLQAWEIEMQDRLNGIRDRELTIFKRYAIMQSLSGAIFTTIPLLVAVSTFALYIHNGMFHSLRMK